MSDPVQEHARRQVEVAMRETGLKLTPLARLAHLSHTTLTRFMNNPDVTHTLSTRTLSKIITAIARVRLERAAITSIEPAPPPRRSAPPLKKGVRK